MRRTWVLIVAALLLNSPEASGIVVRHDQPDSLYIARAHHYPAAVTVLPDGSGTLVAPHFVLTAAHIARGVANRGPRVEVAGREHDIERIYVHPEWSGRGAHDIALLKLKRPITDVRPALLYRADNEVGQIVTFVGRGDSGNGKTGPTTMDRLKRAATNRIDDADADWLYCTFDAPDTATALEGVSGPGDSGGPALVERDGALHVLGVSVFSFNGKPGRYGTREGYTRVSTHVDWLDSILAGTAADSGMAPGGAPRAASGDAGGRRVVMRRGVSDVDLEDVPAGGVVAGYLETFNSGSGEQMADFLEAHFSDAYRARRSREKHVAFYQRLLNEELGRLTLQGVVASSPTKIVVRVSGAKLAEVELHFVLDANQQIDDLMIARIDAVRR